MSNYKNYEMFSVHGDQQTLDKKIKDFQSIGWVRIGNLNVDHKPEFVTLGWPIDKDNPIYPDGY